MPAYAIAHLRTPQVNDDIVEYIDKIQGTMTPFGGRFLVHGPTVEVIEGTWPGSIVILEFPDSDAARAWYASPAYQEILPLRTNNIEADTILAEGVPPAYDTVRRAAKLREQLSAQQ